jgi:hypothetical protein
LHRLWVEVRRGGFHRYLGLKVRAARERRREDAERAREAADTRKPQVRPVWPHGESLLAEIRKHRGMRDLSVPIADGANYYTVMILVHRSNRFHAAH